MLNNIIQIKNTHTPPASK